MKEKVRFLRDDRIKKGSSLRMNAPEIPDHIACTERQNSRKLA